MKKGRGRERRREREERGIEEERKGKRTGGYALGEERQGEEEEGRVRKREQRGREGIRMKGTEKESIIFVLLW